jgi:hypothetical protein
MLEAGNLRVQQLETIQILWVILRMKSTAVLV